MSSVLASFMRKLVLEQLKLLGGGGVVGCVSHMARHLFPELPFISIPSSMLL